MELQYKQHEHGRYQYYGTNLEHRIQDYIYL